MALHEQSVGATDEWYTPPHVFEAMGVTFDMDVASPGGEVTPWIPAHEFVRKGVVVPWEGFIWMNPPFGGRNGLAPWLKRFIEHGNGIALVPDRTSAPWWQAYAARASLTLAVARKIQFLSPTPGPRKKPAPNMPGFYVGTSPAQGTTLLACGMLGCQALTNAADAGLGSLWSPIRRAA